MPSIITTPRRHTAHRRITISDGTGNDTVITNDSDGLSLDGALTLSDDKYINANSTGFFFEFATSVPSTRSDAKFLQITDSTGTAFVINQTGTTWVYLNTTSVRPS